MGNRLLEELRNRPHPGYEWLSDRLQAPPVAPESDLKVRLDGFFRLTYADTYTAAWQALLPRMKELAIPILYLQRHSLELIVKDRIRSLWNIREEMRLHHEVFGSAALASVLDATDQREDFKYTGRHELEPLFDCLARNLRLLELPPLPPEFRTVLGLLDDVEQGNETRLRYDTQKNSWESSFEYDDKAPKIAHVGQISRLLKTIVNEHERLGEDPRDEPVSFVDHVAQVGISVNDDITFALQDLEKGTKNDEVVWRLERTKGIKYDDQHPDTDALKAGFGEWCLRAQFGGRRMVVLVVPAYGKDYPHVLACVREGKLSRLLWPPRYNSNVAFAAIGSVKKHDPGAFNRDDNLE